MVNLKPVFFYVLLSVFLFYAQEAYNQKVEPVLTIQEIAATIDSISNKLQKNYIFPKIADQMAQRLSDNLKKGTYRSLVDPSEFARQLTKDLQALSQDKHLRVVYDPPTIAREQALTAEDRANQESEWIKELVEHLKRDNFGFRETKILEGNIGYLDLREFADPNYGGETLAAVMKFLSNTDAIIIDLRQNGGGSPAMVQLLSSYFFSSEPLHLTDFYNRPKNEHTQSWTLPYVSGTRRPNVDLYILTSRTTFSAAEGFSYEMKNLNRATIIGETTAGGAHLTGSVIVTDKFFVRIPQGRAISPITKTNWEGTGVKPHVEVSAEEALKVAHAKAVEKLKK